MVSLLGWLNGLTATGVILMAIIFGLLSFYHAKKLDAKLLSVAGIIMILSGLLYLGPLADFLSVLLLGKNLDPPHLLSLLSYMWIAPAIVAAMYLGAELMIPEKKWYFVGIYIILGLIFELFLWLDTANTFIYAPLENPGEDLLDASFNRASPAFFLIAIFLVSIFVFLGIGFAIKAKQATGELRKKFGFLSLAFITFVISGVFETLIPPGIGLVFVRLGMVFYAGFMFIGLKT